MDRCFTVYCGGTGQFALVPRGKMCLLDICCQTTTVEEEQHTLRLALGPACVFTMYVTWASLLARQESPSLYLSWLPPVLTGKRPGRRSYLYGLHLPSLWGEGCRGTSTRAGGALHGSSPLSPPQRVTATPPPLLANASPAPPPLRDPSDNVSRPPGSYLCRYPHQSLSCLLPPSLPINHVLSVVFVLLLFLFSPCLLFL